MYRKALKDLISWKNSPDRKPLVLEGARQVGKTWLLKEFGNKYYENCIYLNLEEDALARNIFDDSFSPADIISRLSIYKNTEINSANTLIIIDEVQENPKALTCLKYFYENAPEYHIAVAGSLLGITLHNNVSFPVGKVDYLKIHPLNFEEFLLAAKKDQLAKTLENQDFATILPFHDKLCELYRQYCIIGGMPEAVNSYITDKNIVKVREIQNNILLDYEHDFSKHANKFDVPKIIDIFNTIPSVLAKENKKFMFGAIKPSARAREYESALLRLLDSGLAVRVFRENKVASPIAAYTDRNAFKLYFLDIGLLGCKVGLQPSVIYNESAIEFKGALAEQFVCQELISKSITPYYYSADDSRAEIDFVIESEDGIMPIEVKSGENLSSPSLTKLLEANKDLKGIKFSMLPYNDSGRIRNMPIYMAGF